MSWRRPLLATSFLAALTPAAGIAQVIDYSGFESMFDEPVTISATGKPERVSDTPVTMDIITANDIKRSGARDLPTLLKRLPDIDVYSGSPGTEELTMGGYNQVLGARVMVLLDGRQIYLGAFGEVFWSSIPVELDEIRQIEVIRGPESALYGFNAVDGVINIITFDPTEEPVNSVTARVGTDARRDISASATQNLAKGIGLRLTVADDHAHDAGAIDSPFSTATPVNPDRKLASATLSAAFENGDRAGLQSSFSDISQRSVASGTSQFFDSRLITEAVKWDYSGETAIGQVGVTGSVTRVEVPEASNQTLGAFRVHDLNEDAQINDLFKLSAKDSVRLGFEARNESMNVVNFSSGTMTGRLLAGSAMWEHQFLPELSWVNAVRYDDFQLGRRGGNLPGDIYSDQQFNRSVEGTSVNSSLIYKLTPDDSLRASFARGLSLPSLLDFGQLAHFAPQYGGFYFYGNPSLLPSAVYEERLGWDHQIAALDATARASLSHEETMHDLVTPITFMPSTRLPGCIPSNPDTFLSCIAEITKDGNGVVIEAVQLQLDHASREGLSWGANYSYDYIHPHAPEDPTDQTPLLENTEPKHKVNANLGYGWGDWAGDIRFFYESKVKGDTQVNAAAALLIPIHPVTILSPHLSWTPSPGLLLDLSVTNLWTYKDNLAQRNGPGGFFSVKASY